jgi:hypothetical protein
MTRRESESSMEHKGLIALKERRLRWMQVKYGGKSHTEAAGKG